MRLILESIRFQGFQAASAEACVIFSGSQTSIIYGTNGSGKTTFLKLIHAVFSKDEDTLVKEKVERIEIAFVDEMDEKHTIRIAPPSDLLGGQGIGATILSGQGVGGLQTYDWQAFDECALSKTRSLSLGVDRGNTVQTAAVESKDIYKFLIGRGEFNLSRISAQAMSEQLAAFLTYQNTVRSRQLRRVKTNDLQLDRDNAFLKSIDISNIESLLLDRYRVARAFASEQIQNALFDTLAIAIDSSSNSDSASAVTIPDNLGELIAAGKERIIEALNDGPENNFKNRIIGILQGMGETEEEFVPPTNPILGQLIWNMLKELKLEKQLLNSINVFAETFSSFLGDGKELEISNEGVSLVVRGDRLGVEALSSGERHLFTFLALVVIDARDRDFLIIDEPEISLNANWQRNLVGLLEELAPDTQIILASHSPILAKGRPSSLVELKPTERRNDV